MKNLLRAAVAGLSLSFALAPAVYAADKTPAVAAPSHKIGDKVWICGCGKACDCNTLQTAPGKCHCGSDLIEATVTKVEGSKVTVKSVNGEQVLTLKKA